jgi:hypothetical protein
MTDDLLRLGCENPIVPDSREWEPEYDLDQTMSLAMGIVIGTSG